MEKQMDSNTARIKDLIEQLKVGSTNTTCFKDPIEQSEVVSTNITWLEDLIEQLKVGSTDTTCFKDPIEQSEVGSTNITCFEDLKEQSEVGSANITRIKDFIEQLETESEESLKKKLEAELTIICIKKTYFTKYLPIKIEEIQEVSNTFETTTTTNESLKQDSNTIGNASSDIGEIGTNTSEQVSMNN